MNGFLPNNKYDLAADSSCRLHGWPALPDLCVVNAGPVIDLQPLRDALAHAKAHGLALRERQLLAQFIPAPAVDYALAWYLAYPFHFVVTEERNSKFGDYTYHRIDKRHQITVNHNLPPQAFLLTYLHEVAHMMVIRLVKQRVSAHGVEWKSIFSQILQPMLRPEVFDAQVLPAMRKYAANPKASSATDPALMRALHFPTGGVQADGSRPLMDFRPQPGFRFKLKGRVFEVVKAGRTTYLCLEPASGKHYKVNRMAVVGVL